jgi:two-component system sensor histidine kinase YesM
MSLHLAEYFRFTIRNNNTSVSLLEELTHIRNYLEIQQLRYPDKLHFTIAVPEQFYGYTIPPLVLQPFVENSMLHGFGNRSEPFDITIAAALEEREPGSDLLIRIADNGSGFSEPLLADLQLDDWSRLAEGDHLGIWNVVRRLKMYIGAQAQVTFANAVPHGATVTLRLPLERGPHQFTEG